MSNKATNTKRKENVEALNLAPITKEEVSATYDDVVESLLEEPELGSNENSIAARLFTGAGTSSNWVKVKDTAVNLNHITAIYSDHENHLVITYMGNYQTPHRIPFGSKEAAEVVRDKLFEVLDVRSLDQ